MTGLDPYRMTDKLDSASLQAIVTRLEARGKHPFFAGMLQDYLEAMGVDGAGTVLDLGCGTGVAARTIARREGFSGKVLGIDLSPYLVKEARRLAAEEGLGERVAFRAGDTRRLDIADGRFDAVVCHTLMGHLDDPPAVVAEIARVVAGGGMVGIFDGDYGSMTFTQDDPEKGRRDDEALVAAIATSPRVMRRMPRLFREAGLELVACLPYVLAEVGTAEFWATGIQSFRKLIPKSGVMTEDEAEAWADGLLRSSDDGVFFGASNYYGYVARKP